MNENRDNQPIEQGLRELEVLQRAGVFARTPCDARAALESMRPSVMTVSRPVPVLLRLGWRWMPIAAAAAVAFGVWGWMFSRELSELRTQRLAGPGVEYIAAAETMTHFPLDCLTGPGERVSEECRALDFDADNRITMADVSHFQLRLVNTTQ